MSQTATLLQFPAAYRPAEPDTAWIRRKFPEYLAARGLAALSTEAYARDVADLLGHFEARQTDPARAEPWMLRDYVYGLRQQGLADATVERKIAAVRALYDFLVEYGRIERSPATKLNAKKRAARRLPSFLTGHEMSVLLEHAYADTTIKPETRIRNTAILELFYATGARVSEIVGLDATDVYMRERVIRVRGKGDKERMLPFGEHARRALTEYLNLRPATGEKALFQNKWGRRITARYIRLALADLARRIRFDKHVHPHMIRHTFATVMLSAGCNLRELQEFLGHESMTTTQIYTHIDTERLKRIFDETHPRH